VRPAQDERRAVYETLRNVQDMLLGEMRASPYPEAKLALNRALNMVDNMMVDAAVPAPTLAPDPPSICVRCASPHDECGCSP
jgi:hypothetical protein